MPTRCRCLLVFLAALALFAATTHRRLFVAGNDASRWATIESIVHDGRASIEGSRFAGTVDQVRVGERLYSNKPPLLALAGAAVYAPLARLTGWSIRGAGAANVVQLVSIALVAIPAALLVAAFHAALGRFREIDRRVRWLLTVALGAGTLLWPFATTLNSHAPAACLLFLSFLAALDGRGGRAGAATGIAAGLDLLPGAGLAPMLAAIAWSRGGAAAVRRFGGGLLATVALAVAANVGHHGSPLPLKMVPGAVDLSARAGKSAWGVVLPESPLYPLEILFGPHGLFAVSPVLLFGLAGLVRACRRVGENEPGTSRQWRWLLAGVALQFAGHAVLAGSYGGWSYGYRYLLPIQPLLLFAAPFVLAPASAARRSLLAAAVLISVLFAALGAYHPWPPGFEQESTKHPVASRVTNPIGGNAAGWLFEHAEGSPFERWATRRYVSADPEAARAYFALFFGSKGDFEMLRRLQP